MSDLGSAKPVATVEFIVDATFCQKSIAAQDVINKSGSISSHSVHDSTEELASACQGNLNVPEVKSDGIILRRCKHIDRAGIRGQCPSGLQHRLHKRGHLAVACEFGHQWVWCPYCCTCGLGRGCDAPIHWMERDSMDTGKRNHMQRHIRDVGPQREKRLREDEEMKQTVAISNMITKPRQKYRAQAVPGSLAFGPRGVNLSITPAPSRRVDGIGESAPEYNMHELEILSKCKHVDRKHSREPCVASLRIRNHKRGYLTVVCEGGHQWVWCSYCCDCERSGIGCSAVQHWMERDSFDTGRRNHMQRHLANYDANNDVDGTIMASLQPRQVAMPKGNSGPSRDKQSHNCIVNDGSLDVGMSSSTSSGDLRSYGQSPILEMSSYNKDAEEDSNSSATGGDAGEGAPTAYSNRSSVEQGALGAKRIKKSSQGEWESFERRDSRGRSSPSIFNEGVPSKGKVPVQESNSCGVATAIAISEAVKKRRTQDADPLESVAEELGSIGHAAVALIALRRCSSINGQGSVSEEQNGVE